MQVHARGKLQGAANEIAGRAGRKNQAFLPGCETLAGRQHVGDRKAAALDDRTHGFFSDIGQASGLVTRCGVGAAVNLPTRQIAVVPVKLAHNGLRYLRRGSALGELVRGVSHLGVFAEHDGRAGPHQQVCCKANCRIGRDTREGIAAATLHTHHQGAGRQGLATPGIEPLQVRPGALHNAVEHGHEPDMVLVLQADRIGRVTGRATLDDGKTAGRQQARGLQFFTAQTDHHDLAAKIGVEADIAQRADRNNGLRRINGHAAAIRVLQADHIIHKGVQGHQLGFDAAHRLSNHARHALHGGGDGQQVARANRAIGVQKAFKTVALEGQRLGHSQAGHGQLAELLRRWHLQLALLHPGACSDVLQRVADGHVVAAHCGAGGNHLQGHLVALGHPLSQHQAAFKHCAGSQPAVIDHDRHVVGRVHADAAGLQLLGRGDGHARISTQLGFCPTGRRCCKSS